MALAVSGGTKILTEQPSWPMVRTVAVSLRVQLRMKNMTLRETQGIQVGQLMLSMQAETTDVPMCIGRVQICWCEFAAVDERMAVRITQLA